METEPVAPIGASKTRNPQNLPKRAQRNPENLRKPPPAPLRKQKQPSTVAGAKETKTKSLKMLVQEVPRRENKPETLT